MPEENNKVLIEVAAQHPLVDGLKPQIEFELRLKKALQIYEKEKTYTPCGNSRAVVSLSHPLWRYVRRTRNKQSIRGGRIRL